MFVPMHAFSHPASMGRNRQVFILMYCKGRSELSFFFLLFFVFLVMPKASFLVLMRN